MYYLIIPPTYKDIQALTPTENSRNAVQAGPHIPMYFDPQEDVPGTIFLNLTGFQISKT